MADTTPRKRRGPKPSVTPSTKKKKKAGDGQEKKPFSQLHHVGI